jgi:UDP-2,3-diacylglucosamine pyrophosphatase LpxH
MKRVVISDIHIGSQYFKAVELLRFLSEVEYDELILAGDIIDFIKVPEFTDRALAIARTVDYSKTIIYVVGNHDTPLRGFIGKEFFGIKFVDKYEFEEGGRKFRVEHGDAYDHPILQNKIFMTLLSIVHDAIEKITEFDITTWWSDYKIKKRKLRRIWDILKKNKDVDVFIMGHSHHPEFVIWGLPDKDDISIKTYVNTGDWVSHQTYVEIIDGIVRLKDYGAGNTDIGSDEFTD